MAAIDHAGQGISGTVDSPLAVGIEIGASCNLRLYPHEHILADDGFVTALLFYAKSLKNCILSAAVEHKVKAANELRRYGSEI